MLDHLFQSECSLKVGRLLREQDQARALSAALSISRDANTGAGQDFTGLAAAVQLRLRVVFGSQTLIVKLRLLPGWNTVQIRGDPLFRRCGSAATAAVS